MGNNKLNNLINVLSNSSSWTSSASLAKMLGVSERTIRNYVKEINSTTVGAVESSNQGYRLSPKHKDFQKFKIDSSNRMYHILSRLLSNKEGIFIFDEANEMNISESTLINNVLPDIKVLIKEFNLSIESRNYQYFLIGSEKDKRKLIGNLVTNNSYGFFVTQASLINLFPSFDVETISTNLYEICNNSNLFLNNYALNNLLLHLLVILIRLESNDNLDVLESYDKFDNLLYSFTQKNEIIELASKIGSFFTTTFGHEIPKSDYQQILILIALSINHEFTHLESIIDKEFIKTIEILLSELARRYGIAPFDNEFVHQFSLHMFNARQRSSFQISYPNPITKQIKKDHAFIYDMAVFFAHSFSKDYHINLSEDEIAFIAFHIGAYLENSKTLTASTTGILIMENYHDLSKKIIHSIKQTFNDTIYFLDVLPLDRYILEKPKSEILITTISDGSIEHPHKVVINPFLTKQNIQMIWKELEIIEEQKTLSRAQGFLKNLFYEDLYFRNINLDSVAEYINFMGKHCIDNNFVKQHFINDVLLRESLSSTAFTDHLAVPHSMHQFAEKSFICVIHNDTPTNWGSKKIHFIFMIGISENDMAFFNDTFNLIIELFGSTERTLDLIETKSFEEFILRIK